MVDGSITMLVTRIYFIVILQYVPRWSGFLISILIMVFTCMTLLSHFSGDTKKLCIKLNCVSSDCYLKYASN